MLNIIFICEVTSEILVRVSSSKVEISKSLSTELLKQINEKTNRQNKHIYLSFEQQQQQKKDENNNGIIFSSLFSGYVFYVIP